MLCQIIINDSVKTINSHNKNTVCTPLSEECDAPGAKSDSDERVYV